MEIIDRLHILMNDRNLTSNALARETGIDPSNFAKMLNGDQKITKKTLGKIISTFHLNPDWLVNGRGEMFSQYPQTTTLISENADYALIPLVNIDSVGGMYSSNELVLSEQFIERFIPFTGAREGDMAIYQSGDSMTPSIPAGSVLLIRKVENWQEYFGYGNTFVLWLTDDRRITKQVLKYSPDPSNYVTCHSFNPEAADEELPRRMIREVWKVIKILIDKGW